MDRTLFVVEVQGSKQDSLLPEKGRPAVTSSDATDAYPWEMAPYNPIFPSTKAFSWGKSSLSLQKHFQFGELFLYYTFSSLSYIGILVDEI